VGDEKKWIILYGGGGSGRVESEEGGRRGFKVSAKGVDFDRVGCVVEAFRGSG